MPGVESLKRRQYYGHPRNQFWTILHRLLRPEDWEDYNDKKATLKDRRILLWDVIHSCRRKGSLDSDLRDIKVNDINRIFDQHRSLRAVFCNGQTTFKLFKKYYHDINLPVLALPSTSPAYTIPLQKKLIGWRKILKFI